MSRNTKNQDNHHVDKNINHTSHLEPYAALNGNNTVLTFYFDNQKKDRKSYGIGPFEDYDTRWGGYLDKITTVVFDNSFANCTTITSTAHWFRNCTNLIIIIGLKNLKTHNVTNMRCMFYGCLNLRHLDLKGFDTSNVEDMSCMFADCFDIKDLDLSGFKTDKVIDMSCMFWGCSNLRSLDLSGFHTDNVVDMGQMFFDCYSLNSLDLSGFETKKVTDMQGMFSGCYGLKCLNLSGCRTNNVRYMRGMFQACTHLTALNLEGFNTSNVENMSFMFADCYVLKELDLSTFETGNVTNMSYMFSYCSSLKRILVSKGWNVSQLVYSDTLFEACTSLTGGNGTKYVANKRDLSYAHIDEAGYPGYLTSKEVIIT